MLLLDQTPPRGASRRGGVKTKVGSPYPNVKVACRAPKTARFRAYETRLRAALIQSTTFPFGRAPIMVAATWPFLNNIMVGMPRTPYFVPVTGCCRC